MKTFIRNGKTIQLSDPVHIAAFVKSGWHEAAEEPPFTSQDISSDTSDNQSVPPNTASSDAPVVQPEPPPATPSATKTSAKNAKTAPGGETTNAGAITTATIESGTENTQQA